MKRLLPVLLLLSGCSKPDPCTAGFIGDRSKPVELSPLYTDGASGMLSDLAGGQMLPLELPPQGGYVMFVGAKARNLDGCEVELAATLSDPSTGAELGFDARSTDLTLEADGWGHPESRVTNLPNVIGCPQVGPKDVQGQSYQLEIKATDRGGRTGSTTLQVIPTCEQPDPSDRQACVCTCSANYTPGKCAPALDGGGSD